MKVFVFLSAVVFAAAAFAGTPEDEWRAMLIRNNAAWASELHAPLKIADAAYIRDGEAASLTSDPSKPGSWHWTKGEKPDAALTATFTDGKAVLVKAGVAVSAAALSTGIAIAPGIDVTGGPTQIAPGVTGLRLWVFDQQNQAAKDFKGVDYFPYDPAFRVSAAFKPDPAMTQRVFRTSRGLDKQFYHAGDAVFTLKGKSVTLPLYGSEKNPAEVMSLSAFFTDELTGKGAYGAGRYVDVQPFGKFPPETLTIDFNFTYNPYCARSPYYNCPFAIDFIPLAVTAGEKDSHAAEH